MEKKEFLEMAKDLGIKINNLKNMPEIGLAETCIQLDPDSDPIVVEGRFYTVATWDNFKTYTPLKEVSGQYKLVQHYEALAQIFERMNDLENLFGKPEVNLAFSGNGGRMFADMKFKESKLTVAKDTIIPILRQENSCDLTRRFCTSFQAERLVCSNGMTVPDSRFPNQEIVRKLHKQGTLDPTSLIEQTLENLETVSDAIQLFGEYEKTEVSKAQIIRILEKEVGISEKQAENVLEIPLRGFENKPLGNDLMGKGKKVSAWKAYNAGTQWITDNTKNPATESERSRKLAEGFDKTLKISL
jgi:predicted protein tyrosine phosphatase